MTRARILADYVNAGDELALKAPLASPAFTGTPTGITAAHLEAGVLPSDVTGGSGLTALGTITSGILSAGVALKIFHVNHSTDSGYHNASSGYNYGTALSIPSSDNPNGAKYLIIVGGGRVYSNADHTINQVGVFLEGGTTWTTTNGTEVSQIITPGAEHPVWWSCPATFGLYTNSSGGAVGVEFKTRLKASSTNDARMYNGEGNISSGIIAIRVH